MLLLRMCCITFAFQHLLLVLCIDHRFGLVESRWLNIVFVNARSEHNSVLFASPPHFKIINLSKENLELLWLQELVVTFSVEVIPLLEKLSLFKGKHVVHSRLLRRYLTALMIVGYESIHIWRPWIQHIGNVLVHLLILVPIWILLGLFGLPVNLVSRLPLTLNLSVLHLLVLLVWMWLVSFNLSELVRLVLLHIGIVLIVLQFFICDSLHSDMLPILKKSLLYQEILLLNLFHLVLRRLKLIF